LYLGNYPGRPWSFSFFIVLSFLDGLLFSTTIIAQTTVCGAVTVSSDRRKPNKTGGADGIRTGDAVCLTSHDSLLTVY
jgi:hypothetical protein